jgi:hypothetical protein
MLLSCYLFAPRLGNINARRSCKKVQLDVPLLAPGKVLRQPGQASAGSVLGSDVSTLETAGSIPSVFVATGGHEVLDAPASPPPNATLSAKAMLSEVEVEQSVQEGMVALEELPRFGLDTALEGALP